VTDGPAWLDAIGQIFPVILDVRDDGVGGARIDPASDATGLRGLRDRVEALGGTFDVRSAPRSGTRHAAGLPLGANGAVG